MTADGVNGDSGRCLDSAAVTFGQLLAGDVNGDRARSTRRISIRSGMNSGSGPVTGATFRNDVIGRAASVNHADIKLTRDAQGNSLP